MPQKPVRVTLANGTASIYERVAQDLGLVTNRGGGERGNITQLLSLLAQSLKDGTIELDSYRVKPARLEPDQK